MDDLNDAFSDDLHEFDRLPDRRQHLRKKREELARNLRTHVIPTMIRVRWERVIVTIGMCIVPFCLFAGTASSHEVDGLIVVNDDFIGPHVRVGYSPITNAERKAAAEEEIRQYEIENGDIDPTEEPSPKELTFLESADDQYQHEGDLDFSEANRDNIIARAIRGWTRLSWVSKIDWNQIREDFADEDGERADVASSQSEETDSPDESVSGYDDIVRLVFSDGVGFSWSLPNGQVVAYDGTNKMSGDAPVCLDLDETVSRMNHAVYVLDHEGDDDSTSKLTFDETSDKYSMVSLTDRVVPDDQDGALMLCSVGSRALREVNVDRREYTVEASRAECESGALSVSTTLLGPKGMLSNDHISVRVTTETGQHIKIQTSCIGVTIWTDDDAGLTDVGVELQYRSRGQEGSAEETIDTGNKRVFIDLEDYLSESE